MLGVQKHYLKPYMYIAYLGDGYYPVSGITPTLVGIPMGHKIGICHSTFVDI